MKYFITTILILSMHVSLFAQADNILGVYWTPKKDGKIEIYKSGDKYHGKIVWATNPRKDTKNPDKTLQQRSLVGATILTDFEYKNGKYDDGEIYDPESGKTYSCVMRLNGNKLNIKGYIGITLFGRTETFERVQ
jgi:uncharacterized protein (DUF2147 family)